MSIIRQRKQKIRHFREPKPGDVYLDAVSCGDTAAIEDYLNRRGRPEYTDCKGQTALHIAIKYQHYGILTHLIRLFDSEQIDQRDMYGLSPRQLAEKLGDNKAAEIIRNYLSILQVSPYVNKNYSFKKPVKRTKKASLKTLSNKKSLSKNNSWNMMSYFPEKRPSVKRQPIIYRNENKKEVYVQEKRKTHKKVPRITVQYQNK
jgi:ankyrin repeat protein